MVSLQSDEELTTIRIERNNEVLALITYTDEPQLHNITGLKDPSIRTLVSSIQCKRSTCTIKNIKIHKQQDTDIIIKYFSNYAKGLGYRTITAFVEPHEKNMFAKNLGFPYCLNLYNLKRALMYRPI